MRNLIALSLLLTWLTSATAGDIYCNAQGRECSDRPTSGSTIVRSTGVSHGSSPPVTVDAANASNPGDRVQQQREQDAMVNKAQKELRKDLTDKRSVQCKQAQDYYRKSVDAQYIYKVGKDGARETLSNKDADQARLKAKLDMDQLCAEAGG